MRNLLLVAALAALGTTWTAIASTRAVAARDNTSINPGVNAGVRIYLLNDTKLADNNADLWDGTIQSPLHITESGLASARSSVWTGTESNGTPCTPCSNFGAFPTALGASNSGAFSNLGTNGVTHFGWINGYSLARQEYGFQLYAISGSLTYVPEPLRYWRWV